LFIPQRRRELLILDTGPIREFVLFNAVYSDGFESLRSELRFFHDEAAVQKYQLFVRSFVRRVTSASVVAELHNWIKHKRDAKSLWKQAYEDFRERKIAEEVAPLLTMDIDLVASVGPVDASLIAIALQSQQQKPAILTIDDELLGRCSSPGIDVFHIWDVLANETDR
jgi:predicted nucleic acid-binding protein